MMLAEKYSISKSTVHSYVQGVEKDLAGVVKKKAEVVLDESRMPRHEKKAVDAEVDRIAEALADQDFIRELTTRNMMILGNKLAATPEMSINDHKLAQEAIDKASITIKVNDRFAAAGNNQTVIENNVVQSITFKGRQRGD